MVKDFGTKGGKCINYEAKRSSVNDEKNKILSKNYF
mgnify:CR=1 FL=1